MKQDNNLKDFKAFADKWIRDALVLGWSMQLIFAVSGTGEKVNQKFLEDLSKIKLSKVQPMESTCSCSQMSDFCDIFGELHGIVACREWHCKKTKIENGGCGLLWKFSCDGICRGIGW